MTSQLPLILKRAPKLLRSVQSLSPCPLSQTQSTCTRFYHVGPRQKISKYQRSLLRIQPVSTSDKAQINAVGLPNVHEQRATVHMYSYVQSPTTLTGKPTEKKGENPRPVLDSAAQTGWVSVKNPFLILCIIDKIFQ